MARYHGRRGLLRGAGAALPLLAAGCAASDAAGILVERDIAYAARPGALLDAYRPADARAGLPVILYFHGGAWQAGRRDELQDVLFARRLAARGAVVVSADYRLLPEARFPNFIEDGAAAAAWVHANAARVGGDPSRLILAGHSAGAYNAALLAADPRYLATAGVPQDAVRGGIALAGVFTDRWLDWTMVRGIFPPEQRPVAPVTRHLGPRTPPLLLLAGSADLVVPVSETRLMAEAARAAGAPVRVLVYPGVGHLGILAGAATALEDAMGFVEGLA